MFERKPKSTQVPELVEAVLKQRPVLRDILDRWGELSLLDYAKSFSVVHKLVPNELKNELIGAVRRQARKLWGESQANSIATDMQSGYYALTADHHGPLSHPFFSDTNLLTLIATQPPQNNVLVLASSLISLNNSSHPRGLLYHNGNKLERLNLFPSSMRQTSVFSCRPYTCADISRLKSDIRKLPQHSKLLPMVEMLLETPDTLACQRYGEQVSLINRQLPQHCFAGQAGIPKLAYLEMESVVADILLQHHLHESTTIHELVFNTTLQKIFVQKINGALVSGTDYFWYEPQGISRRIALRIQGNTLVSLDGNHHIDFRPEVVARLLVRRELVPSTILSLIILSAYYGLRCLGGFHQTTYLTAAQEHYNHLILGTPADKLEHTQTLGADFAIGYLQTCDGLVTATALDLILYGGTQNWEIYMQAAKTLTVRQAFYSILPDSYADLYNESTRKEDLARITTDEVLEFFGLKNILKPIGNTSFR